MDSYSNQTYDEIAIGATLSVSRCLSHVFIMDVLTSRADSVRTRLASAAVMALVAQARRTQSTPTPH